MSAPVGRNVILLVFDSARADLFTEHAPNFNEFARSGMVFTRAIAPAGWTLPSHVSMFSGLAPTEHGAVALGRKDGTAANLSNARRVTTDLARRGSLLAPRLSDARIRTFSASPTPWLGPASGLDAGFSVTDFFHFLQPEGRSAPPPLPRTTLGRVRGLGRAVRRQSAWVRSGRDKGADRILGSMQRFIKGGGPFFAFTNMIETHEPHLAPPGYRTSTRAYLFNAAGIAIQPFIARWQRVRWHNWGVRGLSERTLERWREAYVAEIRYLDRKLADLMELLERLRVADDTVVICTSDHGEAFGEKGVVGHGLSLSEAGARVPLGIWGAGIEPRVVHEPVGLARLRATVEELMLGSSSDASVLSSTGRGTASIEVETPSHVTRPPRRARKEASGPGAAFYDGAMKFVTDPFSGESLYDLDADPSEERDLLGETSPTPQQQSMADEWRARTS